MIVALLLLVVVEAAVNGCKAAAAIPDKLFTALVQDVNNAPLSGKEAVVEKVRVRKKFLRKCSVVTCSHKHNIY